MLLGAVGKTQQFLLLLILHFCHYNRHYETLRWSLVWVNFLYLITSLLKCSWRLSSCPACVMRPSTLSPTTPKVNRKSNKPDVKEGQRLYFFKSVIFRVLCGKNARPTQQLCISRWCSLKSRRESSCWLTVFIGIKWLFQPGPLLTHSQEIRLSQGL